MRMKAGTTYPFVVAEIHRHRLHDISVTMFDQAPFVAPSLTFGALALAWGKKPEELLAEIADAR
jgi:hypothetical protein